MVDKEQSEDMALECFPSTKHHLTRAQLIDAIAESPCYVAGQTVAMIDSMLANGWIIQHADGTLTRTLSCGNG